MASYILRSLKPVASNTLAKHARITKRWRPTATATYDQCVLNAPETRITTLPNGLRVATEDCDSQSCTVGFWVESGSRYETNSTNGVANMFEHLVYRGSKTRSQSLLVKEIEGMGAHLNSYIGREHSAFYGKASSKDIEKVLDVIADILQNPSLDSADIEAERATIMREVNESDTDMQQVVLDYLHASAYQGTPLARSISGPTENIRSLGKEDILDYVNANLKAPRIVLSASGGVDHDQLVRAAEKSVGSMKATYEGTEIPVLTPCRFTGSEIRHRDDSMQFAHVALAIEGAGWDSPDHMPLLLANMLVGNWDKTHCGDGAVSSKLAQAAFDGSLCEGFQSFYNSYSNTALWGCYFVAHKLSLEDFIYNIQSEWMRLCTSVTDSEADRAKAQLRTSMLLQTQGTTPKADEIGRQVLMHGRRIPFAEMDNMISQVTPAQIRDVCTKYMYDKCPAIASLGPIEQVPDYNRLRAGMYWLRL